MLPTPETHPQAAAEYDPFAAVYDRWMGKDFCRRALPVIESLLLNELPPGSAILDVCCGSGQMARALAQRGYHVTGIDCSPRMIELAVENVPQGEFLLSDARESNFDRCFDAAISTFNSLAHFESADELQRVFECVYCALRPGGLFCFDLSTEEAYTSKWRGSLSVVEGDHACIVRPAYDPHTRLGSNRITVFEPGEAGWQRSDFSITQKCHHEHEVAAALASADFADINSYDAQRDLGMVSESGRRFFLSRRLN